jgi:hypothetical protein
MKQLAHEIEIQASAERVWHILTDFASFPRWNPFIHRADGEPTPGTKLEVTLRPSGTAGRTSRPTVMKAEPNHELRWLGQMLMPGLLDVEHIFIIEALDADRVRFTQREIFTGLLAPLRATRQNTDTRRGFKEMNNALKLRAEQPRSAD